MTRRSRMATILAGLAMLAVMGVGFRVAFLSMADSESGTMPDMPAMPGMKMPPSPKGQAPAKKGSTDTPSGPTAEPPSIITIPQERLQTVGVKYEPVARRSLEKLIRTVGRVAVDERRLAKVTIKFHGWIERLFVSAVGDRVRKGQELFTIYSPDLVATQEEYLLALQGRKQLGESEFPEVARSSQELLEATRHRLHLWDISEEHIRDLERTKQVTKTLPIHSPITGTVIQKEVLQGTHVEPGEELYTIADLSRLWVLADIYEYELPFVKVGQQASVSLSYDPGTVLTGRVGFIYPTLDPKTRTAKVRFELDNAGEKLKPDMYANVEL
ncbi:MAG TPA: efflux RND transporter periplasmic adaptor subunit, partial [Nitrospira sp.]|nr:efflux RND transporter periplasmic adaptor subunit [Nitrospira sp.]